MKSQGLAEWVKKQICPTTCCLQETHSKYKDLDMLNVKGQKTYLLQISIKGMQN
jgi:hypothetical protein